MNQRRQLLWTVLVVLAGMGAVHAAGRPDRAARALNEESQDVQRRLSLYAQALVQRIDRFRTLPEVLALDSELRTALAQPLTLAAVQALNHKLEQANGASQSSTLTLDCPRRPGAGRQ